MEVIPTAAPSTYNGKPFHLIVKCTHEEMLFHRVNLSTHFYRRVKWNKQKAFFVVEWITEDAAY